jgi:2,4-dienoyl-CoA reductase-like NADH-dependent reductase (Old Yellow Enzyme family)
MSSAFPHLFAPGWIGTLELGNRVIKAPQGLGYGNRDGTVSERTIRHYRRVAQGGAGLVIVAAAHVDPSIGKSFHGQLLLTDDEFVAGLARLAQTIRNEGACAGLQLEHCGRQSFLGIPPVKAPSPVPWPAMYEAIGLVPEELTREEIRATVAAFGSAARRAVLAGFDLVELHGAHGYLITNFLSPHTNKRTDEYGGPLENRVRFLAEVIESVRAQVPEGFPVTVRLDGTDYEPDGITIEETVEVAQLAERLGIDAVHVTGGDHHTMTFQVSPMLMPRAIHVWAAEAVKRAVEIPVIASGSITLPEIAEDVLATGKADFVSLGRPLLADPFWPAKAKAGRAADIRPCIRCNDGCLDRTFMRYQASTCSVNPTVGNEEELELEPAVGPRRVAVAGGGPAGLEAARGLAVRGHQITLYEPGRLGGALHEAAAPEFKADLRPYLDYLVRQVESLGIAVRAEAATGSALRDGGYDAVVVATGARPRALEVPGAAQHAVAADGAVASAIVVGGGFVGAETALRLAEAGAAVTLVEAGDELMRGDVITDRITYGERLGASGVRVLLGSTVVAVRRDGVTLADGRELETQRVVAAVGRVSNRSLADEARAAGVDVHVVGDALRPGRIHDAVHGAYALARRL